MKIRVFDADFTDLNDPYSSVFFDLARFLSKLRFDRLGVDDRSKHQRTGKFDSSISRFQIGSTSKSSGENSNVNRNRIDENSRIIRRTKLENSFSHFHLSVASLQRFAFVSKLDRKTWQNKRRIVIKRFSSSCSKFYSNERRSILENVFTGVFYGY